MRTRSQAPGYNTPGFFDALRGSYFKKAAHPYITKGNYIKWIVKPSRVFKTAYRTSAPPQPEQNRDSFRRYTANTKYQFFKKNVGFLALVITQKIRWVCVSKIGFFAKTCDF